MGEKKLSHLRLIPMSGSVKRSGSPMSILVVSVHVRSGFEKDACDFYMASPGRPVQRR